MSTPRRQQDLRTVRQKPGFCVDIFGPGQRFRVRNPVFCVSPNQKTFKPGLGYIGELVCGSTGKGK